MAALYIVPTPIGNLEDITQRALRVLEEVDLIAAEDTRNTLSLLRHFSIQNKTVSLHEHNEAGRTQQILQLMQQGQSIALVSDAGTPLISDPGYGLVRDVRAAGFDVVPLPGACAAVTALSAAGLATDRFCFEGFLPAKSGAKQERLAALDRETRTMVFYESPRRIVDTLNAVLQRWGDERRVVLAKELTKTFEALVDGTANTIIEWLQEDEKRQQGEMVLMIAGAPKSDDLALEQAIELARKLAEHLPTKQAAAIAAEQYGVKKNPIYKQLIQE